MELLCPAKIQEGFIDAVYFHVGGITGKRAHHTIGNTAVKGIIRRINSYVIFHQHVFNSKGGFSHFDAQGFGFFRTGYYASVVITQYNYRPRFDLGVEEPLTARIEIVTIYNGDHFVFC